MVRIPDTNIRVDNFKYQEDNFRQGIYFLTHMHTDHIEGLHPN